MKYWYTYKICYSDETAFYFGKGCKNRAYQHLKNISSDNSAMHHVINDITSHGYDIIVKIIEYFDIENDAFKHEKMLVVSNMSSGLLTNVVYNKVGHSVMKHIQKLASLKYSDRTCKQKWEDEISIVGETIQAWEPSIEETYIKEDAIELALQISNYFIDNIEMNEPKYKRLRTILKILSLTLDNLLTMSNVSKDRLIHRTLTEHDKNTMLTIINAISINKRDVYYDIDDINWYGY